MLKIHFDKDLNFPRPASWNITVYGVDNFKPTSFINAYSVNKSKMEYNYDGSIDIYIQPDSPGPSQEPNWLRSPNGEFFLVMRIAMPSTVTREDIISASQQLKPTGS